MDKFVILYVLLVTLFFSAKLSFAENISPFGVKCLLVVSTSKGAKNFEGFGRTQDEARESAWVECEKLLKDKCIVESDEQFYFK